MRKGDIIRLDITGQGMDGEGIGKHENIAVFLPYTIKGEEVAAKVTFVKKSFATASVIKMIKASPMRREPRCPVYYKCGGCDLLHIDESKHREIKEEQLINNFRKIAKEQIAVNDYIESDITTGYRNKVQLPFGVVDGEAVVGYYVNNTHNIVPNSECLLVGEWAHKLTKIVLDYVNVFQISVYNELEHDGLLRHLVMRKLGNSISMVIVINGTRLPNSDKLIEMIGDHLPYDINIHLNVNNDKTNLILGDRYIKLKGKENITCDIMGVHAEISPQSFMQVNDNIRDKIYQKTAELLQSSDILIDLYSGIGITSNIMAKLVKHVYSIEIVSEAVNNAKRIAELNGNKDRITCLKGDVAILLPQLVADIRAKYGDNVKISVLLDPPRKGCDTQVMQTLRNVAPQQIIYISCNHATLARDYSVLNSAVVVDNDTSADQSSSATTNSAADVVSAHNELNLSDSNSYSIAYTALFDMFPNTHHIETLCCLVRKRETSGNQK